MTPIDGRRNPKGDAWGKKIKRPGRRRGLGCLSVLIPIPTIPDRVGPRARARVAGRPATQPPGRPAREAS